MAEGFSPAHVSTDFYKAIGVDRNATNTQIKKRIHSLAKELHPDKTHTSKTEPMMKELNKIKSVLLNEVEKKKYDEDLATKVEGYVPLFMRENRGNILLPPSKISFVVCGVLFSQHFPGSFLIGVVCYCCLK